MNTRTMLAAGLLGISAILGSCTSQNDEPALAEGTGTLTLSLTTNTAFTKAINENDYTNTGNYTVQILNSSDNTEAEFLYSEASKHLPLQLSNGSYTLKAYYGEESAASRNGFRVEGSQLFNVQGEDISVTVNCAPTCGKVVANFDPEMDTYFSDYSVVYTSPQLKAASRTATWAKEDTEPYYLGLDDPTNGDEITATIHFTRVSDGKAATMERTYTLAANKSWTLNIAPINNNGSIGITVTVNTDTIDEEIDIEVPSEWL